MEFVLKTKTASREWYFYMKKSKKRTQPAILDRALEGTCILFHFSAQFVFTISKTELDYYHQRWNVRVASQVVERLKTEDLRKLGNFKKIPEMLGFDGEYPATHPKGKF